MLESFFLIIYMDGATGDRGRKLSEQNNYNSCENVSFGPMIEIQFNKVL